MIVLAFFWQSLINESVLRCPLGYWTRIQYLHRISTHYEQGHHLDRCVLALSCLSELT
ncbi:hypothetical protein SynBIOSE41_02357 [Synechococcus sp. BIOS-E4-1]|nr:hypothetical protein SynBIOSE41_02357 [Synechococcus sp. BIOS-E4-1]